MEVSDIRQIKELEEENRRLKQMYAELRPKKPNARENDKKVVRPTAKCKEWVEILQSRFNASISQCCQVICLNRTAYYYQPRWTNDDERAGVLLALIEKDPRRGFPKCRKRVKALGYIWEHKKSYQV